MRHFFRTYFLKIILILVGLELIYFVWLQYRNHRPVAVTDEITMFENQSSKIDMLRNDSDKDEQEITLVSTTDPLNGKLVNINEKIVEYIPDSGFFGRDSFTYIITDGKKESRPGEVKLIVQGNAAPRANNDEFTIFPWTVAKLPLLNNDFDREGDSIYISEFTQPLNGELQKKDGILVYKPVANNFESDSFRYYVSDGRKTSESALVTVKTKQVKSSIFSNIPYYGDLKNYEPYDVTKWDLIDDKGNLAVGINTSNYNAFDGDRPGACNLIKNRIFKGDFTLKVRVKCTDDLQANGSADYCLFFNYVDEMNYSYASFSSHAEGDVYTAVFKMIDGVRTSIGYKGQAFNDNEYHKIVLTKKGNTVSCTIDGKPSFTGTTEEFGIKGKIGIGSYNDMANFDDLEIISAYDTVKD